MSVNWYLVDVTFLLEHIFCEISILLEGTSKFSGLFIFFSDCKWRPDYWLISSG